MQYVQITTDADSWLRASTGAPITATALCIEERRGVVMKAIEVNFTPLTGMLTRRERPELKGQQIERSENDSWVFLAGAGHLRPKSEIASWVAAITAADAKALADLDRDIRIESEMAEAERLHAIYQAARSQLSAAESIEYRKLEGLRARLQTQATKTRAIRRSQARKIIAAAEAACNKALAPLFAKVEEAAAPLRAFYKERAHRWYPGTEESFVYGGPRY